MEALVQADVTVGDRTNLELRNLWFVGEDSAGIDGPSAVSVRVRGGHLGELTIDNCRLERAEMRDSSQAIERPNVMVDLGPGFATVTVQNSTIHASPDGAFSASIGPGTTVANRADPRFYFISNDFIVEGSETSKHAISFDVSGEKSFATDAFEVRGNYIGRSQATGVGGFETGIRVAIDPDGTAEQTILKGRLKLVANTIEDCTGDGVWLRSDRTGVAASERIVVRDVERITITGCGGAGIRLDRGDVLGGYLNVEMYGNLIASNKYGIVVHGIDTDAGWSVSGSTIVDNTSYAIAANDLLGNVPTNVVNSIIYDNAGGGVQVGSASPVAEYGTAVA